MSVRYPYEGDSHYATIIMLPYREDIWINSGKDAWDAIYQMALVITRYEKLILLAMPKIYEEAKNKFNLENVIVLPIEYNDAWARDICPIYLLDDKKTVAINFDFNAWGGQIDGLYKDYSLDVLVKEKINSFLKINSKKIPFILEGGSINTNGEGVLLTTEACLLSKGRNPKYTKEEIENILKEKLCQKEIIWLPHGIVDDETNEHVDNMAVFLDNKTILLAWSDNGLQHEYSKSALEILEAKGYRVIKMPVPSPDLLITDDEASKIVINTDAKNRLVGTKMAASYVNFYQGKNYILLPQFGCKEDELAYKILNDFYKGKKEICRISSRAILVSGGNIHCITMQIPKGENL